MEFRDWLALLRRYWVTIAVTTVIGAAVGGAAALTQPRTFTSSSDLLLSPSAIAADGQDLAYSGQYVLSRMKTYQRLATSATVVAESAAKLPAGASMGTVNATWDPDTTVLTIAVTDSSAHDAQRGLTLVVQQFRETLTRIERGSEHTAEVSSAVISPATLPTAPNSARSVAFVVFDAVLGFLVGLAVALFRRLRRG